MIHLALVRHAKSDWGDPSLPDHDRVLNARGRRDAPLMAARLVERRFPAERVLASTAIRAKTTAAAFATALEVPLHLDEELYGASARTLLAVAAGSDVNALVLVAHNPGMSMAVRELSEHRIGQMPTCAVATFSWDTDDWSTIDAMPPAEWSFDAPHTS